VPDDLSVRDDSSIDDEELLWRRISPEHVVSDSDGTRRPSSAAFSDSSDSTPLSVDLASIAGDPSVTLESHSGFGLAELVVADVRKLGLGVWPDPLPHNEAHAGITGRKTRGTRRALARVARWRVEP